MDFVLPFLALSAGRLSLSLLFDSDALKHSQLLSSPLTSFLRLQEGLYLFEANSDPYAGGFFHHSPLFLLIFSTIVPTGKKSAAVLWTCCDMLGAWALVNIWRARARGSTGPKEGLVAASYLLNPYIFLPTLSLSTSSFDNTLTLLSIMFASQGRRPAALLTLAVTSHLSLSSTLLLPSLLLLLLSTPVSHLALPRPFNGTLRTTLGKCLPLFFEFLFYAVSLTACSTLAAGGWSWVKPTWGASLTLPDLTPNCGMWWYFFTEIFDHFRSFFLIVFSVHLVTYVVPFCIKFQHDPLYATFLMLGVLGMFKPYPTLSDPGLFLSMIALFPEIYPYLRHPFVTGLIHLHASLLMPLFNRLWLSQGTGNANFFYASTLVFGCANGAALIDCVWAGLRTAVGEEKEGYAVIQE